MKRLSVILLSAWAMPASALSLSEAVQRAAEQDPRFLAQAERIAQDEAAVSEVRAGFFPQISLRAEREYRDRRLPSTTSAGGNDSYNNAGPSEGWDQVDETELTLTQVLWNPVIGRQVDQARAEVQLSLAQLELARNQVIANVVGDYIDALRQAETVQLLGQEVSAVGEGLKIAWARYLDGTARETEALRAEGRVLSVSSQLQAAELDLQGRLSALSLRVGLIPDRLAGVQGRGSIAVPQGIDTALAKRRNPDIVIAQQAIALAERGVDVRRAAYSPVIDLRLGERSEEGRRDVLQNDGTLRGELDDVRDTTARIELRWDLYSGGARRARVDGAQAEVKAAELELRAAESEFEVDLRSALQRARLAISQQRSAQATRDAFEKVAVEQRAAFDAGVISINDLLDAERELGSAQAEFVLAKYDALQARVDLARLSGDLTEEFIAELESALVAPVDVQGLVGKDA